MSNIVFLRRGGAEGAGQGKSLVAAGRNLVESSVPALLILDGANIEISQTSLCCEAGN